MLKKVTFKAGASMGEPSLELPLSQVTIFVGPNNGGKSRALVEVEAFLTQPTPNAGDVVASVELVEWSEEEVERELATMLCEPSRGEVVNADHVLIGKLRPQDNSLARFQIHKPGLLEEAKAPNGRKRHRFAPFASLFTLRMDGKNRLALVDDRPAGDLQTLPPNHLAHLFQDNVRRGQLRQIVFDAFGKYLVLDPTNVGNLRFRLSPTAPVDEMQERGWHQAAKEFHAKASLIAEASDGVRAFVGMLTTLVAGAPKVTLIDEPEAFLHPALSARLGKELTATLKNSDRQLFVATHSAAFLMGCFQGGAAINIVRLTYDYATATARLLAKDKLTHLMRNPLLRSVGVLNALFYNAVVVTESDADRAFYQEINERLLAEKDPRAIDGCLFLNAQNKQTVWDIVKPLRELGIPTVGIVDIDVLKEGGAVWAKPLEGAFIPAGSHEVLQRDRQNTFDAFTATGRNMKRDGGIALLTKEAKQACQDLFKRLSDYGVFVVPNGEVEHWLTGVQVQRGHQTWLVNIFEAMGEDPSQAAYIRPAAGDVWDFMGDIRKWVADNNRKGIPN
jgi:ABC-type cobalamin/Fe3+-siderophores transport system ATPase subunit